MIGKIKKALDFMRNQHFEVPFIAFYRKEYVQPELTINDLWRVYKFDAKASVILLNVHLLIISSVYCNYLWKTEKQTRHKERKLIFWAASIEWVCNVAYSGLQFDKMISGPDISCLFVKVGGNWDALYGDSPCCMQKYTHCAETVSTVCITISSLLFLFLN